MKKDKFEKGHTCSHKDVAKSNDKWIVCPVMPVEVMASGASAECEKLEQKK